MWLTTLYLYKCKPRILTQFMLCQSWTFFRNKGTGILNDFEYVVVGSNLISTLFHFMFFFHSPSKCVCSQFSATSQFSVLHLHCAATSYHTIVFSPLFLSFFPTAFHRWPNYLIMLPLRYSYVLTLTFQLTQRKHCTWVRWMELRIGCTSLKQVC